MKMFSAFKSRWQMLFEWSWFNACSNWNARRDFSALPFDCFFSFGEPCATSGNRFWYFLLVGFHKILKQLVFKILKNGSM